MQTAGTAPCHLGVQLFYVRLAHFLTLDHDPLMSEQAPARKRRVQRGFGWLSVAAGLAGFVFAMLTQAPVFVDTFDPKHPPGLLDVLIPNLILITPFWVVPAAVVLVAGWAIQSVRNRS